MPSGNVLPIAVVRSRPMLLGMSPSPRKPGPAGNARGSLHVSSTKDVWKWFCTSENGSSGKSQTPQDAIGWILHQELPEDCLSLAQIRNREPPRPDWIARRGMRSSSIAVHVNWPGAFRSASRLHARCQKPVGTWSNGKCQDASGCYLHHMNVYHRFKSQTGRFSHCSGPLAFAKVRGPDEMCA